MSKALKAAIEANDPDGVRKAVKGVKDINRKLPKARTPLFYACEKGAADVLAALFEAGAIAEKRHTFPGDTPFAVAAQYEQTQVMQRLWDSKQASPAAVDHALDNATMEGRAAALEGILSAAEQEKFVVDTFGFYCEPGRKLDVAFTGYGAETFDGVVFVSN